ncbi:MAG: ATP-binding protein [Lautropia sp.]
MTLEIVRLVRNLPEPALLVDGDGVITCANRAFVRMAGHGDAALEAVSLASLVRDDAQKVAAYLRSCARSRQMVPGAFRWARAVGDALAVRCDGMVVRPRSGSQAALILLRCRFKDESTERFALLNRKMADLSREVLERRKIELQRDALLESERAARLDAERTSRIKDDFLATLSHELRTPLSAVLGWAQVLSQPQVTPEQIATGIRSIHRNARAQAQLVDDLLDLSRIVSGRVRLDVATLDPIAVIEAAVDTVMPAARARGIRLQLALDPAAGPVKGDRDRLQQVVWNLLSNAVKFTPKGGHVQVTLERVASHVEIAVSDDGEGIPPAFADRLFERFSQADSSTTRSRAGLGLGLSIVKHLVELHGGTVRASSAGRDQGSTFVVELPLMLARAPAPTEAAAPAAPAPTASGTAADAGPSAPAWRASPTDLGGVTVLVVDDEPDAREMMAAMLQSCGAVVTCAASATDALAQVAAASPMLVLCDVGMPGMDGYAFVRALRERERGRARLPVVAVTAFARAEDRTRAMRAGFSAHLAKPVDAMEVVATVGSLLGRTGAG